MFIRNFATAFVFSATLGTVASAASMSFDVEAEAHSLAAGGSGLDTGITLSIGDMFSVSAAVDDYWTLGSSPDHVINADGNSQTTGTPSFGSYEDFVTRQSFLYGQLVGRIGSGAYFAVGTSFSGTAGTAGSLILLNWDENFADNSGSILATVTTPGPVNPIPLPASALMLLAGVIGLGAARRRVL